MNLVRLSETTIVRVEDGAAHVLASADEKRIGQTIPLADLAAERGWTQVEPEPPEAPFVPWLLNLLREAFRRR